MYQGCRALTFALARLSCNICFECGCCGTCRVVTHVNLERHKLWRSRLTWVTTQQVTNGKSWVIRLRRTSNITRAVPSRTQTWHSPYRSDESLPSTTTCLYCHAFYCRSSHLSYSGCHPSHQPRWCSVYILVTRYCNKKWSCCHQYEVQTGEYVIVYIALRALHAHHSELEIRQSSCVYFCVKNYRFFPTAHSSSSLFYSQALLELIL